MSTSPLDTLNRIAPYFSDDVRRLLAAAQDHWRERACLMALADAIIEAGAPSKRFAWKYVAAVRYLTRRKYQLSQAAMLVHDRTQIGMVCRQRIRAALRSRQGMCPIQVVDHRQQPARIPAIFTRNYPSGITPLGREIPQWRPGSYGSPRTYNSCIIVGALWVLRYADPRTRKEKC